MTEKEIVLETIRALPDDCSLEDRSTERAFIIMVAHRLISKVIG